MALPAVSMAEELARRLPVKTLRFSRSAGFWAAIDRDLALGG
jgi:hypothetical protein